MSLLLAANKYVSGQMSLEEYGSVTKKLLGKGAESCQIIGEERSPFSDRAEAASALTEWTTP